MTNKLDKIDMRLIDTETAHHSSKLVALKLNEVISTLNDLLASKEPDDKPDSAATSKDSEPGQDSKQEA